MANNAGDLIAQLSGLSMLFGGTPTQVPAPQPANNQPNRQQNPYVYTGQPQPQPEYKPLPQPTVVAPPSQPYTAVPAQAPQSPHQSSAAQNPYVYRGPAAPPQNQSQAMPPIDRAPVQPPVQPPVQNQSEAMPPIVRWAPQQAPQQEPAQSAPPVPGARYMGGYRPNQAPTQAPVDQITGAAPLLSFGSIKAPDMDSTLGRMASSASATAGLGLRPQPQRQTPAAPQAQRQTPAPTQAQPQAQPAPTQKVGTPLYMNPPPPNTTPESWFDTKIIGIESGGNQHDRNGRPLTSPAGAIGIAQVMPATARETAAAHGIEWSDQRYRNDPAYNRQLGLEYFKDQLAIFGGDYEKATAAYNCGPGNVQKALSRAQKSGGDWRSYLPAETQNYLRMAGSDGFSANNGSGAGGYTSTNSNGGYGGGYQDQNAETSMFMHNPPMSWDTNKDGKVGFWERIKANPEAALTGLAAILYAADGSPQSQQMLQGLMGNLMDEKKLTAKQRADAAQQQRVDRQQAIDNARADRRLALDEARYQRDITANGKPETFVGPDGIQYYYPKDQNGSYSYDANGAPIAKPVPNVGAKPAKTAGATNPDGSPLVPQVTIDAATVRQQANEIISDPALGRVTGPIMGGGKNNVDDLPFWQRGIYATGDAIAGGDSMALIERIGQLQNGSWLAARQLLKGGGAITDYESRKAEGAFGRMSRAKSAEEFKAAVEEFASAVEAGENKLKAAGKYPSQSAQSGGLPQPKTQADYDAIPSGSQYIHTDGTTRVKQ